MSDFRDAIYGKTNGLQPSRDASAFYADLASQYPFMSPDYIRYHLTEAQLFGYEQHLHAIQKRNAVSIARALVDELMRRIMPAFGFKVKS